MLCISFFLSSCIHEIKLGYVIIFLFCLNTNSSIFWLTVHILKGKRLAKEPGDHCVRCGAILWVVHVHETPLVVTKCEVLWVACRVVSRTVSLCHDEKGAWLSLPRVVFDLFFFGLGFRCSLSLLGLFNRLGVGKCI